MINDDNSPMDTTRAHEVYSALCDRVNTEIECFWHRADVLLAVNFGLVAVGFAEPARDLFFTVLLAMTGVAAAVLLLLVATRGRAWLYFWEDRLADVEASMPEPRVFPGHWDKRRSRIRKGEPRAVTKLVVPIPFVFIILWLTLIAYRFF